MELDRILGEAQATHHAMQDAARNSGDKVARDIVRLRTRFATLVAEMIGAVRADPRLQKQPSVANEFETKVGDMRHALAEHQSKWRSAEIDADPQGYRRATDDLEHTQDGFYAWAKTALTGL